MCDSINNILNRMTISDGNQFLASLFIQMNGFLDERTVRLITGLSGEQRKLLSTSGEFPEKIVVNGRARGYRVKDIQQWLGENPA
jgi:predicted DNA-binding transcriptional regulator AlpA